LREDLVAQLTQDMADAEDEHLLRRVQSLLDSHG